MRPALKLIIPFFILSGCETDEGVVKKDVTPPESCFDILVEEENIPNYCTKYHFTLDASCSSDDTTPQADLLVRWDFESDGVWDTEFSDSKKVDTYTPSSTSNWQVTCEVMDSAGNVRMSKKIFESDIVPVQPDIVAGAVFFIVGSEWYINEIQAGEFFSVGIFSNCMGSFSVFTVILELDGEFLDQMDVGCTGGLNSCGSVGTGSFKIDTPGEYVISATWDTEDVHEETNEENNFASATITVK